jgi:hypothetical protein
MPSYTVSLRSILIYTPIYPYVFQVYFFLKFLQPTLCMHFLLHYVCHMIHPSHRLWYDWRINIWQWAQIMNFLLCSLILYPGTSSLLGTNISQPLVLKHSSDFIILLIWQQASQHWEHVHPIVFSLKKQSFDLPVLYPPFRGEGVYFWNSHVTKKWYTIITWGNREV